MQVYTAKTGLIAHINKQKQPGLSLGFVPTMGALHQGHLSLVKAALSMNEYVVVSIFINPTQFNNKKDYNTYPKNLKKDLSYLRKLNIDYIYLPTIKQIYSKKNDEIKLNKSQNILCAKFRKGHFEGVLDLSLIHI